MGGVAHAVGGYQQKEFGFGGTARAALELVLFREFGIYGQASGTWLGAGALPLDPTLAPLDAASSYAGMGGLHLRPFARKGAGRTWSLAGLWLGGGGGIAYTGGASHPVVDAALGLDLMLPKTVIGLGPMLGWEHVFQQNTELRPQDANVLFVGVHGVLDIGIAPESTDGDRDSDGIRDSLDKCPTEPEDIDGFEDTDGCPDKDNDQDGIPDREDLCPNEPETKNGYADDDGCPDAEQIRVLGDKIVLDDRVHFMVNSHIIRGISYPLLERLARLINQHPEYVSIDVQGHTDERGPDWYNEKLSQDRANAVLEFLVSRGVKRTRLSAHGFGKSKPLVDKNSEYAWYMNRRVEFEITREHKDTTFTTLNGEIPQNESKPTSGPPASSAPESTTPASETTAPPEAPKSPVKQSSKANKKSQSPTAPIDDPELRALPLNEEHPESENTP